MFNDEEHPLFGKDTICHKCSRAAVWVPPGLITGYYHYCRECKVEAGPFAKDIQLPLFELPTIDGGKLTEMDGIIYYSSSKYVPSISQVNHQMEMQERMDQLLFDFMLPPSADHPV